jgi:valyl-tRNA synthetase
MEKTFDHQKIEEAVYALWEKADAFKASDSGKPYTILMPPPNANASLHAGHAMYVIDDLVVRQKRMDGYSAVWIPGMDHAGFETQFVYEKNLSKEGKSRMDFDRKSLYENIFNFVKQNSGLIYSQFRKLGFSADWERSIFTLDDSVLLKVFETFKRMEREGKVYRDEYIVNYCTHCGTSLAELEVDHIERTDNLYFINYPLLDDPGKHVTVATVRPETMFGDTAVAINPKDKRFKNLVGKKLKLPLTSRVIPIIEDEMVDMEFGTGAVKITPAHDPNDFAAGRKHNLEVISVVDLKGRMRIPNDVEVRDLEGLKIKEARDRTVEYLEKGEYLKSEMISRNYLHSVTVCYKCGRDLEPTITPNWFIKVDELKKPVIEAVKADKVTFYPRKFKKQMLQWLSIMHDWPISRQIVWGIRIPVWYEIKPEDSNIWVSWINKDGELKQGIVKQFLDEGTPLSEIESGLQRVQALTGSSAPKYIVAINKPGESYLPETDTFDTWFSSGQWPLLTLNENEMNSRLPTDFMGTLSDILKFWISRMIMFSLYVKGKVPFKNVYLWSMVADAKGIKMSKSKGNVINPIELVDKYGADALRMTLIYGVAPGSKIPLSEDKVRGMRNFSNKVWNIGRFIRLWLVENDKKVLNFKKNTTGLQPEDKILLSELEVLIDKCSTGYEKFRFSESAEALYEFLWHKFADMYVEKIKERRTDEKALSTCCYAFTVCLKLLHPMMPFVTEAVWQELKNSNLIELEPMLIEASWPKTQTG